MKNKTGSIYKLVLWTLVAFCVVLYPLYHFGGAAVVVSVTIGYLLSLINIIFGYTSIQWGFGKSTKTFFSVVMGGMAIRFVLFITALVVISRCTEFPVSWFIVSFVLCYMYLQYHEIRLVNQKLKK